MILSVFDTSLWRHRQGESAPANRGSMFNPRGLTTNYREWEEAWAKHVFKGENFLPLNSDEDDAVSDWSPCHLVIEDAWEDVWAGLGGAGVYHPSCIFSHCYCILLIHNWSYWIKWLKRENNA